MERLAEWKTPEAASALLRRFTVQVPQATMDLEEKQYAVKLLVQMSACAVEPILHFIRAEPDVTFPIRALRDLVPPEDFTAALSGVLREMSGGYTRWPEAKKALIEHLPEASYEQVRETVLRSLDDEDDDVCIAAVEYLARSGGEEIRERLVELLLSTGDRPRVRGHILGLLSEKEWPVKGFRKRVEEILADPFYLTSKGTVKRRG